MTRADDAPGAGDEVRQLLRRALEAYAADADAVAVLDHLLERLDAPLQVALAGKLKAGKSTLLNALLGEELAATDHAECTRVVTWYRYAAVPSVTVHPVVGKPWPSPPRRGSSGLEIDLRGVRPEEIDRIEVAWPASGLHSMTLIDTPGLDSVLHEVSEQTSAFLTATDEESPVDAVVYLMRHLHATDVRFLETFQHGRAERAAAAATIVVLSRADEVGAGRIDAMLSATRVAERYRADPALRRLCHTVVPVTGLLAFTGQTLRAEEYAALRRLGSLDRAVIEGLLLSVDRFRRPSLMLPVTAEVRAQLLARLGLFGVRLSLALLRARDSRESTLAGELVRRSGLVELQRVLGTQLMERRDQLRAQAAVLALARMLEENPPPGPVGDELAARCEQFTLAAHELRELHLLAHVRGAEIDLPGGVRADAERLLGAAGQGPLDRLGLRPDARPADVRSAAARALEQWRARADDPLLDRETRQACRVLARTCEGLLLEPVSVEREPA